MRDRLKLPQHFDAGLLQRDLRNAEGSEWVDHFVPEHYEGTWSVLPLRAPAGARHPIQMIYSDPACTDYVDTPLLLRCPYVRQVLAALECPLEAVRLMKLAPGSSVKLHNDHDLDAASGHVRLHIPIVTNPAVDFRLNGSRVEMREGECWYLRLSDPHEVSNRGVTDRVHLVVDAVMNPWLAEQLTRADVSRGAQPRVTTAAGDELDGWIPFNVRSDSPEPAVDWCHLGDARFEDPFFEQTLMNARRRLNQPAPRRTSIEVLRTRHSTRPGVAPAGFIFHVSRCGSTLFSRLASACPGAVVISEAAVIDQVLRAPVPEATRISWLQAVLSALGQPRRGDEQRMVIKFDAWHTAHIGLVQAAFPHVPCVFLYREPAEVLASQLRMPGMFMVPGVAESLLGMATLGVPMERDEHAARVLGALYALALPHARANRVMLMNYSELPGAAYDQLMIWCGLEGSAVLQDALSHISRFDAKEPSIPFDASSVARPDARVSAVARRFMAKSYSELESIRTPRRPSRS
jgi:hypothetical protein